MSDVAPGTFDQQVQAFSDKIGDLLVRCLPNVPDMEVTRIGQRARIRPEGQDDKRGGIPLMGGGQTLAWLRLDYLCRFDQAETYLAIDKSKIWIVAKVDSTPIFRFEYVYDAQWVPHSHIQVHGQRGALSHLLSKTGHSSPHEMSALHLPTGGSRFRPDLEDVIQFLLSDCGFEAVNGWQDAVDEARAGWRVIQTRAATRAMAEEAAGELERLGYTVTPPEGGHPHPGRKARFAW